MQTLLLTFAFFTIAVLLMTAGVLISGRSLKGSCGGPSCKCNSEGKDLGACDSEESTLPIHPSDAGFR
ncbi:hypothetical protein ACFLQM_00780, partial [Acidobacteriota bacterium]